MFQWYDYEYKHAQLVNSWLDEEAVTMTGIDDGWDAYWQAVKEDSVNFPGCEDFCKVIFDHAVPFAAVCFGIYHNVMTISEIIVAPEFRGQGRGSRLLAELVATARKHGNDTVDRVTAVVFPSNAASQRAFRKAGFYLEQKTDDGIDLIFTYLL